MKGMFPSVSRALGELYRTAAMSPPFFVLFKLFGLTQPEFSEPQSFSLSVVKSACFSRRVEIPPVPSSDGKYGAPIPVWYTNSPETLSMWLQDNLPSTTDGVATPTATIGFDVESVPNAPWINSQLKGPATVQIATVHAAIVVQFVDSNGNPSDFAAPPIQSVLANKFIVKAGIGIDQDMLDLYRKWNCSGKILSRFDMGGIGATVDGTTSLKALTSSVAKVDLPKSRKVTLSHWGQIPLTDSQIAYCARDAWAAAVVMAELELRDPALFSTAALIQMLESEDDIADLESRAKSRKAAKTRINDIMGKGSKRLPRGTLTNEQRREIDELACFLRESAPKPLFRHDI